MAKSEKMDIIAKLNADPTKANWEAARKKLLDEGRYYYVFFPNGMKGKSSLFDANVVIYNKAGKQLYKVPVYQKEGRGVRGATIHLKGLEINRSIIKG